MRRPTIIAAALAADLAVGALLLTPVAGADASTEPAADTTAPTADPPIRTGRSDDAPPAPADPLDPPEASPPVVRTGRAGDPAADYSAEDRPVDGTDRADSGGGASDGPSQDGAPIRPPAVPTPAVPTPAVPTPAVPTPAVPTPAVPTPAVPTPAVSTRPDSASTPASSAPPSLDVVAAAPVGTPGTHAVVPGDNLWEIAAARVAAVTGRIRADLTALEIAPYWTRLCILNRPHLRSGDPSLIYAGEVIELPQV